MSGDRHMHPAVYSCERSIAFDPTISQSELRSRTGRFAADLTGSLHDDGCRLIGHIKGLFLAGDGGHLAFSVTSFGEAAHCNGKLPESVAGAMLTVNIIVYGVGIDTVTISFEKAFMRLLTAGDALHESKGPQGMHRK
jgi:hypothetical protein